MIFNKMFGMILFTKLDGLEMTLDILEYGTIAF